MRPTLQETVPLQRRSADSARESAGFDLLRVPLLGRFLKWRYSRVTLQLPVLLLSLVMIAHAFWGSQLPPRNLGVLLTWVHFRGLVVIVLLVAGNLFCMACPFLLPRQLARRWLTPRWQWPAKLRNKWPAIVLFVLVLFAYELFDLWAAPWWTGVVIVAYFAAAFLVDSLFQRASFCKFVCPVGQFNFLSSTMSPLEVSVRDGEVCNACRTKDCIKGTFGPAVAGSPNELLPVLQRGCELALFQPRKVGNLDCTFCLDCVYACPHDNIGVHSRLPGDDLAQSGSRSGLGVVEQRFDFTVLAAVFTFGALLNAFAMISPVYALEQWIATATGLRVEFPILGGIFVAALVLEPAILLGAAAWATRAATAAETPLLQVINAFAKSLIPIGFGVWLAHYGFHFFTGFLTVVPVTQSAAEEVFGWPILGRSLWHLGGLPENVVYPMELGFLGLGLIGSWLVSWAIAKDQFPHRTQAAFAPWAVLHALLFGFAVWILSQPMDMRGTFLGG